MFSLYDNGVYFFSTPEIQDRSDKLTAKVYFC